MAYSKHFIKAWTERLKAAERRKEIADGHKVRWGPLAEEFDVTDAGLRHWRNGTRPPRLDHFFRMCEYAGTDARYVLFGEEEPKRTTAPTTAATAKGARRKAEV